MRPAPCGGRLLAYAAYDATTLRHLAVRPDAWGDGLARPASSGRSRRRGRPARERLCCGACARTRRARGLYEHLGWRPTGTVRAARWPPHPAEMEHELA